MNSLKKIFELNKRFIVIFVSMGIWTLLAHGMVIFNKFSYHDDATAFNSIGTTYSSGRWMLGILDKTVVSIMGSRHYSLPIVNGLITSIIIALMVYIISCKLKIESTILNVLICGIFISFPAITGIFGYMFTAPYYYLGALFGVLGAYIFSMKKNFFTAFICTTLMACSVGVYQANIPICICSLLIFILSDICDSKAEWKCFWKKVIINIILCIGFMIEYFLINRLFLYKLGISMSSYKGLNNFGKTSIKGYIYRIYRAYKEFLCPTQNISSNMFPFAEKQVYMFLNFIIFVITVIFLISIYKINKNKAIQYALIFAVYPFAAYFIYFMVDVSEIHGLMTFGEVFTFILAAWIIEKTLKKNIIEFYLKKIGMILLGIILFLNIRFSNICYLKAEMLQSQAISYYTTLSMQIKNTDGYADEIPVVYINEYNKNENSVCGINYLFDNITLPPYEPNSIINDYAWKETMAQWCGFSPVIGNISIYDGNEEVANMPCYPDKGSIKYIDGQIVVKFSE